MRYDHIQYSPLMNVVFGGLGIMFLIMALTLEPFLYFLSLFIVMEILLLLFYGLRVQVNEEKIKIKYGAGIIHKSWNISEIMSCKAVRNKWWYGFGIRFTPHGWLFNVYGLDAIEVVKRDGKTFRIGTDEPKKLEFVVNNLLKTTKA